MYADYLAFLPSDLRPDPALVPESTWWPWRGNRIHVVRVARPEARVRAMVIHGAGGHAGALWPFAALAAERGAEVVVPDLPGYGRTEVADRRRIRYGDWVDCLTDLVRAQAAADPRPLVLVGASMGGMLAYEAAARTRAVAAVVATCLLDPRLPQARDVIGRVRWTGRHATRLLLPALDDVRVPMRWIADMGAIANVPELTRLVCADRLGGGTRMPLGFLRTFVGWTPSVEPENFTACPVWLTHPGADRWTPPAVSRAFFDRLAAPTRFIELEGAGHFPVERPGIDQLISALVELRDLVADATAGPHTS